VWYHQVRYPTTLSRGQNSCLTGNELDWRAATKNIACRQLAVEAKKLLVGQHNVLTHNTSIFNGNTLKIYFAVTSLFLPQRQKRQDG
jgi:hypothetical protein